MYHHQRRVRAVWRAGVGCMIAVAAAAACGHRDTHPTTSSTPPVVADVKTLIVGVDEVSRIGGVGQLTPYPPSDQPKQFPRRGMPEPCWPIYHDDAAFDGAWRQFHAVAYATSTASGPGQAASFVDSTQSVGVYKDPETARAQFDRTVAALSRCESLHNARYAITLTKSDPSTLAVHTDQCEFVIEVKSAVLWKVGAIAFPDSAHVASNVGDIIAGRIS
jgi:hypothetical protein